MQSSFCIVFKGEILAGRPLTEVKRRVELLFKLPPQKVEMMFSGATVVLRKGLSSEEAEHYLKAFNNAGMHVYVVREDKPVAAHNEMKAAPVEFPQSASGDETQAVEVNVAVSSSALQIGHIQCPVCGCKQPKRTLCLGCGLDMPRYLASQKEEMERDRSEKQYELQQKMLERKERLQRRDDEGVPALLGFSCFGRIGRRTFLIMLLLQSCVITAATAVLFKVFFSTLLSLLEEGGSFALSTSAMACLGLIILANIIGFWWWIRAMVLRSHDIGWPGTPAVILGLLVIAAGVALGVGYIPPVSVLYFFFAFVLVFSLALLLKPGGGGSNQYGDEPPPRGWFWVIMSLGLMIVISISANHVMRGSAEQLLKVLQQQHQQQQDE